MLSLEGSEHVFSVEMKSKQYVKNISISDEAHDRVLFEGNLGKLLGISYVEGDVLELIGVNGVLRINLTREQLQEIIKSASRVNPSSELGSYTSTRET
jgi:hypothetical protein